MCLPQWVVVFPKRVCHYLDIDAGCLNREAEVVLSFRYDQVP